MPAHSDNGRHAILLMLLAVLLFAFMDGGMKWLGVDYPPLQVASMRGLVALPLVLGWILARRRLHTLLHIHWPLHILRGVLGILMMVGFVYGLARMPMATAYSIVFVSPLLVTALAVPILGEKVGPRRWAAIGVGMLGVLVVLRPTGAGVMTTAGLALLGASICYSFASITVRVLARRDSTEAMVFWFLAMLAVGAGVLAWSNWVPIRSEDLWIFLMVGISGALGQVVLTNAFRLGEASQIAPLEYSGLLWVVLMDLTVWGVLPDRMTWLGAGIIVASGIYLLHRERIQAPERESPPVKPN
ncbi:DMT family transporter [Luteimonas qiangzhengi]|uniref:DMT family transporter n=1 Tax=Luteimonas sp. MJ146 TaxID=3129240 RepID=UPI0031BAF888